MCLHVCLLIWLYNMQAHEICTHHFIYSMCSQFFHNQLTVKQIWISCIQHSLHLTREEPICCTCPRDCAVFVFLLEVVFLSVFVFLLVFAFFSVFVFVLLSSNDKLSDKVPVDPVMSCCWGTKHLIWTLTRWVQFEIEKDIGQIIRLG